MKTADLIGPAIDWAVAKCESVEVEYINDGITRCLLRYHHSPVYRPSVDWAIGGPVIEREGITLRCGLHGWDAELEEFDAISHGPTALIAAMRCFVSSKLGDEDDVPEELLS